MSVPEVETGFRVIGQQAASAAVLRAAAGGRIQRTLLVHGPPGSGKGAFVDDLLALLFCTDPEAARRPCNACRGCRDARARVHPDLVMGSPDRWRDERSTGESIVAVARRWLLDASGAPVVGERRIVLVEGADRANEQTQNALLKALEEPAPRQMFILVADEPTRLLPTIRSRAQALRVGAVSHAELQAWLVDRWRLPADQADAVARIAGGLVGRAATYVEQPALLDWRRRTQAELLGLLGSGTADRFGSVRDLLDSGARLGATPPDAEPGEDEEPARTPASAQRAAAMLVVDAWIGLSRDLMLAAAGRPSLAPAAQLLDGLPAAAARLGTEPMPAFLSVLERAREGLRQNAAPRLALEMAMLAWPRFGAALPARAG